VPQQEVGVAPAAVDVADQRVEPEHPAGEVRLEHVHRRVEAECAGQEVHAEVEARAGTQEVLHLLVRFGPAEDRVDLHEHELGDRQAEAPGRARRRPPRDEDLASLSGADELHDVGAEVVGLHDPRQGAALAQRQHVAGRPNGPQHPCMVSGHTAPMQQRYEYLVVPIREAVFGGKIKAEVVQDALNDKAREGWQLKTMTSAKVRGRLGPSGTDGLLATFERPL
jgi:hypothetical protein